MKKLLCTRFTIQRRTPDNFLFSMAKKLFKKTTHFQFDSAARSKGSSKWVMFTTQIVNILNLFFIVVIDSRLVTYSIRSPFRSHEPYYATYRQMLFYFDNSRSTNSSLLPFLSIPVSNSIAFRTINSNARGIVLRPVMFYASFLQNGHQPCTQ